MEISEAASTLCEMVLDMRMRRKELQHAIERYLAKMCIIWNGDLKVFNVKMPSLTII